LKTLRAPASPLCRLVRTCPVAIFIAANRSMVLLRLNSWVIVPVSAGFMRSDGGVRSRARHAGPAGAAAVTFTRIV